MRSPQPIDPFRAAFRRYLGPRSDQTHAPKLAISGGRYANAGTEPPLDEVLADPLVRLRAQADGLDLAAVQRVIIAAQRSREPLDQI